MLVSTTYKFEVREVRDNTWYQIGPEFNSFDSAILYRDRSWKFDLDKRKKIPPNRIVKIEVHETIVD